MIDGADNDKVQKIKKAIKGLVNVIFGAVYFDWKLLEQGAKKMNEGFSFILAVFRLFA